VLASALAGVAGLVAASAADARKGRISAAREMAIPADRDAEITQAKAIFARSARLATRYGAAAAAAIGAYLFITYVI
jgi:hypothetical protein